MGCSSSKDEFLKQKEVIDKKIKTINEIKGSKEISNEDKTKILNSVNELESDLKKMKEILEKQKNLKVVLVDEIQEKERIFDETRKMIEFVSSDVIVHLTLR